MILLTINEYLRMKKKSFYALTLLVSVMMMGFSACGSDDVLGDEKPTSKDEVKVYFVYTLDTSSGTSMNRAPAKAAKTNAEVFDEFYTKIKSGELVAPSYELTLTEVSTGATYTFKGNWNSHDLITLNTGTYHVVGKSTAEGENIQEKCSIVFDEVCDISITSNVITLHASYDCFLLIFNNTDIQTLQNYNGTSLASFFTLGTSYKYAFVKDQLYQTDKKKDAYILGKYTDGAEFKVFTGNLEFEKGKYYVYNSISNGFNLPEMEEGNVPNHSYVDLGLPSGRKWATRNIGASVEYEYGELYAWGEVKTKSDYQTPLYSYSTLDTAKELWGNSWTIPTKADFEELINKCTWKTITKNGIKGSEITGPNGNTIFLPWSGWINATTIISRGTEGIYWSSTLGGDEKGAYELRVGEAGWDPVKSKPWIYEDGRSGGRNIRPVLK